MNIILTVLSGLLFALSFPKFELFYLVWIAAVPLIIAIYNSKSFKQAFTLGSICFVTYFSINLISALTLCKWVGIYGFVAYIGLIALQTIFFLPFIWAAKVNSEKKSLLFLPAVWVVIEWLKSQTSFGVLGAALGYSQYRMVPLIQIADITGVYGVSFLIIIVNTAIAHLILARDKRQFFLCAALVASVVFYGYSKIPVKYNPAKKVAIIQGYIEQKTMLDESKTNFIYNVYKFYTVRAAKNNTNIIIWPEGAVPTYIYNEAKYKDMLQDIKTPMLIGTPYMAENGAIYNSIMAISDAGKITGRYDKQYLVPFGEYLPFRPIFYPLLKSSKLFEEEFSAGKSTSIIQIEGLNVGGGVCFESLFPHVIRKKISDGANIILIVTNDAWFLRSSEVYLHFCASIFRAIENRKFVIQAANTGISGIIDPSGYFESSKINERCIFYGLIEPNNIKTFYTAYGDLFVYINLILICYLIPSIYRKPKTTAAKSS